MIQTAHFWKIFFHGHQSCQNTSENKKTVVNGLLKVKVHGLERLHSRASRLFIKLLYVFISPPWRYRMEVRQSGICSCLVHWNFQNVLLLSDHPVPSLLPFIPYPYISCLCTYHKGTQIHLCEELMANYPYACSLP